jgi:hypothetical protein
MGLRPDGPDTKELSAVMYRGTTAPVVEGPKVFFSARSYFTSSSFHPYLLGAVAVGNTGACVCPARVRTRPLSEIWQASYFGSTAISDTRVYGAALL